MFKFIFALNRNHSQFFKYLKFTNRYYRTKYRKKVSIELNKPSLYDDRRTAPSKLLKENLFTPESAGCRELSMLCFWIVNYGYAHYSILSRYVQCAIENIKKLKIKAIALIFHSVSKFLFDKKITLIESHQLEDSESEIESRQKLIIQCVRLILESSKFLPNLFVNAVPKDLGMISLSLTNIHKMFIDECNVDKVEVLKIDANSDVKTGQNTTNQLETLKSVTQIVNKLLQRLSQEIIPKMAFCEMDEFAAFAKAFSKINTDWSSHFMRELSHEVSSVLMDKIEDLEMLARDKFVGEDLIEQLNKVPRDLSTITCSVSICKLNVNKFWERSNRLIGLLLDMKHKNHGIKDVDITTLTLLCTSMCKYVDVTRIVNEMLELSSSEHHNAILVGFNTSIRSLKDEAMAKRFLKKLNVKKLVDMNTRLVSQFICNFARSGLTENEEVRDGIISLLENDLEEQILCSIYVSKKALSVPTGKVVELSKRLSYNLNNIETVSLVNILMTSTGPLTTSVNSSCTSDNCNSTDIGNNCSTGAISNNEIRGLCKQAIQVLSTRVEQIPIRMILPLLSLVINNFGGSLRFMSRLCKKIDENINDFDILEIKRIADEMSAIGLNVNKLFKKSIMGIRESANTKLNGKLSYSIDTDALTDDSDDISCFTNDNYESKQQSASESLDYIYEHDNFKDFECVSTDKRAHYEVKGATQKLYFSKKDENEISAIAECTLSRNESVHMLNADDFQDDYQTEDMFELTKYPENKKDQQLNVKNENIEESVQSRSLKAVSRVTTMEQLESEWSSLRQAIN